MKAMLVCRLLKIFWALHILVVGGWMGLAVEEDEEGVLFDKSRWYLSQDAGRLTASGLELNWTNPVAPDQITVALPSQPLSSVGDVAEVRYEFRATGDTNLMGGGDIRFGIFDSNGNAYVQSENTGYRMDPWTTYLGYQLRFSPFTSLDEDPPTAQFRKRTNFDNNSLIQASGRWSVIGDSVPGFGVPNDLFVPLILRAERTSPSTVVFSVSLNNVTYSVEDGDSEKQPQQVDTLAIYFPSSKEYTNFTLRADPEAGRCTIHLAASSSMRVGQTNAFVRISTGKELDLGSDVTVELVSTDDGVATVDGAADGRRTVLFPAGREYSSITVPIAGLAAGVTTLYLTNAVGAAGCGISTNSIRNSARLTVTCGNVDITGTTHPMLAGQSNRSFTVSFEQGLNHAAPLSVEVSSADPAVAVPAGASGGTLKLHFPIGSETGTTVGITPLKPGATTFYLTNLVASGCATATGTTPVTVIEAGAPLEKKEDFASGNSASANGWVESGSREGGHNYGFSSGNLFGNGGEAGGEIVRVDTRSFYADVFGGQLTLDNRIEARGKLLVTFPPFDNSINIGHFDSTAPSGGRNIIGFTLSEPPALPRVWAFMGLASGSVTEVAAEAGLDLAAGVYDWEYVYDPAGGPEGNGQFSLRMTSAFGNPIERVVDLTANQRAVGANFDSFGIVYRGLGNPDPDDRASLFVDEVTYTAAEAPAKPLSIRSIEVLGGNVHLKVSSPSPNRVHLVEETSNLQTVSWQPVANATVSGPVDGILTISLPTPDANRFYQVLLP